jgi:hypothetical protein
MVRFAYVAVHSPEVLVALRVASEAVSQSELVECSIQPECKQAHGRAIARVKPIDQLLDRKQRLALNKVQAIVNSLA